MELTPASKIDYIERLFALVQAGTHSVRDGLRMAFQV